MASAIVFKIVVATKATDDGMPAGRRETGRAIHPDQGNVGLITPRDAGHLDTSPQIKRWPETCGLGLAACCGQLLHAFGKRPGHRKLLDAALGQRGDQIDKEGLSAAMAGSGHQLQNAHGDTTQLVCGLPGARL